MGGDGKAQPLIKTLFGESRPTISPDGRRLFYRRGGAVTNAVMAVTVEAGQAFIPGTPSVLFDGQYDLSDTRGWDIAPDGQRFLMFKGDNAPSNTAGHIIVVQHWFEELKRLVPVN